MSEDTRSGRKSPLCPLTLKSLPPLFPEQGSCLPTYCDGPATRALRKEEATGTGVRVQGRRKGTPTILPGGQNRRAPEMGGSSPEGGKKPRSEYSHRGSPPRWLVAVVPRQSSIFGFHTSQTRPTRSGPGFRVGLPGRQPDGVASAPSVSRTSWKAWICRTVSDTFRPTGGVRTS